VVDLGQVVERGWVVEPGLEMGSVLAMGSDWAMGSDRAASSIQSSCPALSRLGFPNLRWWGFLRQCSSSLPRSRLRSCFQVRVWSGCQSSGWGYCRSVGLESDEIPSRSSCAARLALNSA
jgi:hypothetical protein